MTERTLCLDDHGYIVGNIHHLKDRNSAVAFSDIGIPSKFHIPRRTKLF